jgi:uncharacterized protein (DUF1330 family)
MSATGSARSGSSVTLVALLYLHPGREAEYERFESEACRIMGRHGGRIVRRIKLESAPGAALPGSAAQPDEVHVVEFVDAASFARYRADPEIRALAELRATAIRDTVVWQGSEAEAFSRD